jgi:hypothetical protein
MAAATVENVLVALPQRLAADALKARQQLEEECDKHFVWLDEIVPAVSHGFSSASAAASPERYVVQARIHIPRVHIQRWGRDFDCHYFSHSLIHLKISSFSPSPSLSLSLTPSLSPCFPLQINNK